MSLLELHLRAERAELSAVEAALEALGALSVTLLDQGDDPILEPAPGTTPLWPRLHVVGLFAADTEPLDLLAELDGRIPAAVFDTARFARVDERDWTRAWMDDWRPLRFGERLWIYPSTLDPPAELSSVIRLDPGLAFGSGTHPTTTLCLEWIERQAWAGETVIDFGCGSGVLAIAALKLGAGRAIGIDNDPQALHASRENALRNGVSERLTLLDRVPSECGAEVLVANILLRTLLELRPVFESLLPPGGRACFSGLLGDQAERFIAAYATAWRQFAVHRREDWIAITAVRAAD